MSEWRWVGLEVAGAIHDRQLAEHGGRDGVVNPGAIDSALARARNLAAHGVVARVFLAANGWRVAFD